MTWVKLDDGFLTHPKVLAAGKDGRALIVSALCYCAQGLTDGLIVDGALPMVAGAADVKARPTAGYLVELGIWHREGHACPTCPSCPPDHYLIHDYLSYQPSAEDEKRKRKELSEKRAAAGRKGAQSRWGDSNADSNADSNGHGKPPDLSSQTDDPGMAPSPYPSVDTSVVQSSSTAYGSHEDDERIPVVARLLGLHDAQTAVARRHLIGDERAFREGCVRRWATDPFLLAMARQHPGVPASELLDIVRDGPPLGGRAGAGPPVTCERCVENQGWIERADGLARCDHVPEARPVLRAVP